MKSTTSRSRLVRSGSWNRIKLGKENRGGSSGIGGKVSVTMGDYGRLDRR